MTAYTTPQLDCASALAAMLDGREIAGFTVRARATDQNPTYEKRDLAELRVDCVIPGGFRLSTLDRGTATEEVIVNVGVQFACERDDEEMKARLRHLCRRIAVLVKLTPLDGFGLPVDDVEVEEIDEMLRENASFFGVIAAPYRAYAEAEE